MAKQNTFSYSLYFFIIYYCTLKDIFMHTKRMRKKKLWWSHAYQDKYIFDACGNLFTHIHDFVVVGVLISCSSSHVCSLNDVAEIYIYMYKFWHAFRILEFGIWIFHFHEYTHESCFIFFVKMCEETCLFDSAKLNYMSFEFLWELWVSKNKQRLPQIYLSVYAFQFNKL